MIYRFDLPTPSSGADHRGSHEFVDLPFHTGPSAFNTPPVTRSTRHKQQKEAKSGKVDQKQKNNFAPGPGTIIAGLSTNNYVHFLQQSASDTNSKAHSWHLLLTGALNGMNTSDNPANKMVALDVS